MPSDVVDLVWASALGAAVVGLLVFAYRRDPHWSSRDGRSFLCRIQVRGRHGEGVGRWREARARVAGDRISLAVRGWGAPLPLVSSHRVTGAEGDPKGHYCVVLLDSDPVVAVRVPSSSRAAATLHALAGSPPTGGADRPA